MFEKIVLYQIYGLGLGEGSQIMVSSWFMM